MEGYDGSIEFNGESITILRDNWRGKVGHGGKSRTVKVAEIVRMDFEIPNFITNGHIRFVVPEYVETFPANDKFGVLFTKKHLPQTQELHDTVSRMLANRGELSRERIVSGRNRWKLKRRPSYT